MRWRLSCSCRPCLAPGIDDGDPEVAQQLTLTTTNNNLLFAAQPANAADGTLTYMPAPNANGVATVTLTLTDDATAGGAALTTAAQTFTITVKPVNLALNKVASASSIFNSTYAAAKAVDGSTATFWLSKATKNNEWVRVDLGSAKSITNVKIFWPATNYAQSFRIETSTDGSRWTSRFSSSSRNGGAAPGFFFAGVASFLSAFALP